MESMLTLMLVFKERVSFYKRTGRIFYLIWLFQKVVYQVVSASSEHSISFYTIAATGPSHTSRWKPPLPLPPPAAP